MKFRFSHRIFFSVLLIFFFYGCSRMERSEQEKLRLQNTKKDLLYRNHNHYLYAIATPEHTPRFPYPWEVDHDLPRIHKEYFRCKGSVMNPPRAQESENEGHPKLFYDCEGVRHGLPIVHGKEGVYPILIDLLNYVQKKTGKRVIITSGHLCPDHQAYADLSSEAKFSKHQIGAEVDFYVQGMEENPLEVVDLLMQYFKETSVYAGKKEYLDFQRYEKGDAKVAIQPWFNKEVFLKIYGQTEGRDADNHHPYPYVSIQVRFDRETGEKVIYSWEKAHRGYTRSG